MSRAEGSLREFQKRLADLKEERGLSLSAMANLCGIPKSTLDGYLKGVSPTLENIVKLSDGLDVSLNLLLAELDGISPHSRTSHPTAGATYEAARSELTDLFETAVRYPVILEVRDGKIGGHTPAEFARSLATHIADIAFGAQSVMEAPGRRETSQEN